MKSVFNGATMFEKLKEIFKTKDNKAPGKTLDDYLNDILKTEDGKPCTVTPVFGCNPSSRLLIHFADNELRTTEKLLIIKMDLDGGLSLFTSENLSTIETVGVLRLAEGMVKDEDC